MLMFPFIYLFLPENLTLFKLKTFWYIFSFIDKFPAARDYRLVSNDDSLTLNLFSNRSFHDTKLSGMVLLTASKAICFLQLLLNRCEVGELNSLYCSWKKCSFFSFFSPPSFFSPYKFYHKAKKWDLVLIMLLTSWMINI